MKTPKANPGEEHRPQLSDLRCREDRITGRDVCPRPFLQIKRKPNGDPDGFRCPHCGSDPKRQQEHLADWRAPHLWPLGQAPAPGNDVPGQELDWSSFRQWVDMLSATKTPRPRLSPALHQRAREVCLQHGGGH